MNDHEKAARYADLHERLLRLLGEIEEANGEVELVRDEMRELFGEMGTVGKLKAFELL